MRQGADQTPNVTELTRLGQCSSASPEPLEAMRRRPCHTFGVDSVPGGSRVRRILIGALPLAAAAAGVSLAANAGTTRTTACLSSLVQYQADPSAGQGLGSVPWVQAAPVSAGLVGHLFYYGGTPWQQASLPRARIYSGGQTPNGGATKILWLAKAGSTAGGLVVVGKRLDARGSFTQGFLNVGGSGDYASGWPSIIKIPHAGCWQLRMKLGTRRAQLTFLAVSPAQ